MSYYRNHNPRTLSTASAGVNRRTRELYGRAAHGEEVAQFIPLVLKDRDCRAAIAASLKAERKDRDAQQDLGGFDYRKIARKRDATSRAYVRSMCEAHATVARFIRSITITPEGNSLSPMRLTLKPS